MPKSEVGRNIAGVLRSLLLTIWLHQKPQQVLYRTHAWHQWLKVIKIIFSVSAEVSTHRNAVFFGSDAVI